MTTRWQEIVYIATPYSVAITPHGFIVVDEDGIAADSTVFSQRFKARELAVSMNVSSGEA